MRNPSPTWRKIFWGKPCQTMLGEVTIGNAKSLPCDSRAVPAFQALDRIMEHYGYTVNAAYPTGDTGLYNCRHIRHDDSRPYSTHAWGIAVDINWNSNPDGSTLTYDIPREAITAVELLETKNSHKPVFRWGGNWDRDDSTTHSYYDPMHFEIIATPNELEEGIQNLPTTSEDGEDAMAMEDGSSGEAVRLVQSAVQKWGQVTNKGDLLPEYGTDGAWGDETSAAVRKYQEAAGYPNTPTGKGDGVTVSLLLRYTDKGYS